MANYGVVIDQNAPHLVELKPRTVEGGYGLLYNWYVVKVTPVSIAPAGWHVPTITELQTLSTFLGGDAISGGKLKETGLDHWDTPNTGADNSSGFTALGAGARDVDGTFCCIKEIFGVWASTETGGDGDCLALQKYDDATIITTVAKKTGISIRLIKNNSIDPGTVTDIDGNVYPTVKIGTQVWMALNLKVTKYNDGTSIPEITDNAAWSGDTAGALCAYDNNWDYVWNRYLIYLLPNAPVIENQSFQIYEEQSSGTTVGHVISTDPNNITYSITAGNTGNAFIINASTGYLTTNTVLDFETLSGYSLTIEVVNNSFPSLSDTAIVSVEVLKLYHVCVDNGLHFNGYSEDLIGLLTVGVVHATTGTLTDYVIEWHLNTISGSTVFITGNSGNTDPSIQSFHPINSELVQAGELYPVVRYANVNGILYSAYSNLGYLYSPDLLTCLPSITVVSMTCSNGSAGLFGHTVQYINTTQPSQLANRSLTYGLNLDSSSKQISYQFYGFAIADRITTSYCTTGGTKTVIDDWVVGLDCTGNTFNSLPKLYTNQWIKRSLSLTGFTYQSGDYLLFDTFPSYNAPGNTDTNWRLSIKCFSGDNLIDFGFQPNTVNDIDTGATMNLVWNTGNCSYDLTVITGVPRVPLSYNSDMYHYTEAGAGGSYEWTTGQTISVLQYTGSSLTWVPYTAYGSPYLLNGVLNIKLTGGTHNLLYTFTDAMDYNHYKTGYTTNITSSHWTDWTSDVNSLNHYKFINDVFKVSMTSGDTFYTYGLYVDSQSVFTFDDVNKTISIALVPQTGVYTGVACDKSSDNFNWIITYTNNLYSGTTWDLNTIWGTQNPFPFMYLTYWPYVYTEATMQTYMFLYNNLLDTSTPLSPEWFLSSGVWYFWKVCLNLKIDNVVDPLNNYSVYSGLNSDGSVSSPVVWTLIKRVP
jgi:uncharacterized protein (TIGR02145 family)